MRCRCCHLATQGAGALVVMQARGLCTQCYSYLRKKGLLHDYPKAINYPERRKSRPLAA